MPSSPITLFLCGDVMTGRGIDQILSHPSKPELYEPYVRSALEYVQMAEAANGPIPKPADSAYIWGDAAAELDRVAPDARILNLETSITTCNEFEPKGINYRMHPANIGVLTALMPDCFVLANNHVVDWGRPGLMETLSTLHAVNVKTAGAGSNVSEATKPAIIEISPGARILVFAVGTPDSGISPDCAATDRRSGVALLPDLSSAAVHRIAATVRAAKRPGDLAVLSIHWGGNWGYHIPQAQRDFSHGVIDHAGVDVLHGHSSHHPKGIEVYNGRPILYGCGDFLNDYEGIAGDEEYRSHLALMYFVSLDPAGCLLGLRMTPMEIRNFRLRHALAQDARWLRDTLDREGKPFGTAVELTGDNRLELTWTSASCLRGSGPDPKV